MVVNWAPFVSTGVQCCLACWCLQDPNALKLTLPEGILITTRVLRRSEEQVADDRFETSEFMQQVFDDGSIGALRRAPCAAQALLAVLVMGALGAGSAAVELASCMTYCVCIHNTQSPRPARQSSVGCSCKAGKPQQLASVSMDSYVILCVGAARCWCATFAAAVICPPCEPPARLIFCIWCVHHDNDGKIHCFHFASAKKDPCLPALLVPRRSATSREGQPVLHEVQVEGRDRSRSSRRAVDSRHAGRQRLLDAVRRHGVVHVGGKQAHHDVYVQDGVHAPSCCHAAGRLCNAYIMTSNAHVESDKQLARRANE